MYDCVCPEKLINVLKWLKVNNPLYTDDENWVDESQANDIDVFQGLCGNHIPYYRYIEWHLGRLHRRTACIQEFF